MFSLRNSPDPMLGTILNQGKKWNNWMSNYKNLGVSKVKLDLIGKTTGPNLGSIVEPLVNPKRKTHLSRLEADFDRLNQEYEKTKSIYLQRVAAGVSTPELKTLQRLNDDMIDVLKKMNTKVIELMPSTGTNWGGDLSKGRDHVHRRARHLKRAATAHGYTLDNVDQLVGEQRTGNRKVTAVYYNYLVWLVIAITLCSFTFKYMI